MTMDYSSLLVDAGEYAGRNDIAQHFDRFLRLAEAKLNRALRVADMEKTADLALVDGDAELPADLLHARAVLLPGGTVLNSVSLQVLSSRYSTGGWPRGYAVVGKTLTVRPKWSGNASLTYYAAIPHLSVQNPTNWLIEKAPDVYLYGVVEEIAIWEKDAAKVAAAQSQRVNAMAGLSMLDERQRWGNGRISVEGATP